MRINLRKTLNYSVTAGKEGVAWYNYTVIESLARKLDLPCPFRNPDKTLSSLIVYLSNMAKYQ